MQETVVVLGASDKPDRYSYKAVKLLQEHGHKVIPVHPTLKDIEGLAVTNNLSAIQEHVDTLTLYVGAAASSTMQAEILALKPKRIIMNPGAENPDLARAATAQNIEVLEACTLVLLKTGQF
jgi:predicted CoA-binding protein